MSLPFLSQPVTLHSSRDPGHCMLTPEQCAYKQRYWVFWYEADHRYGLPTIAFFLSCIIVFTVVHALAVFAPDSWTRSAPWRRAASAARWASYRRWRLGGWSSQSLGAYLLGAVGFVFFAAMTLAPKPYYWPNTKELSYGNSPPIATRAGWMALACLPFILILSTKANPVASLIGTSHENLIVWHNWISWAMYVLALIHTFPFIVYHIWMGDIVAEWNTGGLWVTGVVALLAQTWLTFFSIRWLRERYYEFFKATHFFAALVFVIFFFLHCDHILTSWDYFIGASVLYSLSWLYSQGRTYFEHGLKHRAQLSLETAEMLKISIDTNAEWTPGQHIYLRFLTLGAHAMTAHPFTICSLKGACENGRNQMVFHVRALGGLTGRLAKLAEKSPGISVPVLLDGPYGGVKNRWFGGFDHVVVIGGGAGAGFTLALARHFLTQSQLSPVRKGKMTLVVSSRDRGMRRWYLEALAEEVANTEKGRPDAEKDGADAVHVSGLSVHIHETGQAETISEGSENDGNDSGEEKVAITSDNTEPIHADIKGVEVGVFRGRPDLFTLCRGAFAAEGASVGLVVCGPGSMVHDVGQIAADAQGNIIKGGSGASEVWFHKESFT